jgi:hypothetical protein
MYFYDLFCMIQLLTELQTFILWTRSCVLDSWWGDSVILHHLSPFRHEIWWSKHYFR